MVFVLSPCCGFISLRNGAKCIALIDLGIAGLVLKLILFTLVILLPVLIRRPQSLKEELDLEILDVVFLFVGLILYTISLILSILLFLAADQKNVRKCRWWLRLWVVVLILELPLLFSSFGILEIILAFLLYIYNFYKLWLVYSFIVELEKPLEIPTLQSPLANV